MSQGLAECYSRSRDDLCEQFFAAAFLYSEQGRPGMRGVKGVMCARVTEEKGGARSECLRRFVNRFGRGGMKKTTRPGRSRCSCVDTWILCTLAR